MHKATRRMRIKDEIKQIRRKKRIAKYRPHHKAEPRGKLNLAKKQEGRPLLLFPSIKNSPEFRNILKWFIMPLIDLQQFYEIPIEQRLDVIFCTATRDIVPAVCIDEVRMPGQVKLEDGSFRFPTTSEAKFAKGCPVFVRIDDTIKEFVEVESCEKPGLLFQLSALEYKACVRSKLREIEGCNYRLDPPGQLQEPDGSYTDVT